MMSVDVPIPVYLRPSQRTGGDGRRRSQSQRKRAIKGTLKGAGRCRAGGGTSGGQDKRAAAHVTLPAKFDLTTPSSLPEAPSRTVVPWCPGKSDGNAPWSATATFLMCVTTEARASLPACSGPEPPSILVTT